MTKTAWFAAAAGLLCGPTLLAQPRCAPSDLTDNWSFVASGQFISLPGFPLAGPFARLAQTTFDGAGNFKVEFERGNYAGIQVTDPLSGTYTMNPDCTGVFIADVPPPIGLAVPFLGILSDSKNELTLQVAGPGVSISGVMRRRSRYGCRNIDLQGGYQIELLGVGLPLAPRPGVIRQLGAVHFDGNGGFRAGVLANYSGESVQEAWSGTYNLTFGCLLTINYTSGGGTEAQTLEGLLADGGRRVYVQHTSHAAVVVNGQLRAQ